MKPLPPSIREKKRYLRFKVHAEEDVELGEVVDAVWDACLEYMGAKDTGKADHWVIKNQFDGESQEGIVRVERSMVDDFRASLCFVESLGGKKGFIEVTAVSGSIKKLESH